jgi:hypothetical protein
MFNFVYGHQFIARIENIASGFGSVRTGSPSKITFLTFVVKYEYPRTSHQPDCPWSHLASNPTLLDLFTSTFFSRLPKIQPINPKIPLINPETMRRTHPKTAVTALNANQAQTRPKTNMTISEASMKIP